MTESNMQQPESVLGYDPRKLFAKGFKLGSVDLIQGGSFSEVIGRTLIALLIGVRGENGKSPFSGITVILPPASTTSLDCESVFDALILGSEALRGTGPNAQELDHLKRTIQILNCPTLDTADLEATVLKSGARRLVAIASASIYRDMQIDSPGAFGASAVLSSEDLWVPHVASLCRLCVAAVKGSNGYAVIHVEESPAVRPNNIEQLCATDDCYVAGLSYDRDEKEEVDQQGHRWLALAFGGEIAKAVAEIEGLQLSEVNRYHVLAQLFSRAAMHDEAIAAITQLLPHIANLEYSNLVQLAWLAHKSGNDSLALHFLPDNAERLSSVMWIEQGLELATIWKNNDLIKVYDDRLAEVYPASAHLRENRDRRLLWNCSATTEAEQAFTTSGFTKNHLGVLSAVTAQEPDYDRIIEQAREWGVDWLELAAICCAMHAWSSGDSRYAADIACQITTSDLYGRQATQVLLWSVRSMMLREQIVRAEQDYYRAPLQAAIRFLAVHPEDESIRSQLSRMLSVDTCGDIGIPMMATTMLDIAEDGVEISKPDEKTQLDEAEESHSTPNEEEIKAAIESGLAWLGTHGAAEFGVTVLPVGLVSHPDETLRYLARMILMSAPKGEDVDLRFLELLAMLACAISPHAKGERNEDLRVMRLVAANCATSGQFQRARNLAEQLLVIGQGSPLRRRLAWLGFADVYHRCRNMAEALVGLACAFATNAPINKADLWQEVHTSVRVLRDLGLIAIAQPVAQPRHESSFRVRMEAWLKDYPRQYGYVESADGDDEFFITMEQLDLRLPATESLLVVAEPLLQQMTINLGLVTPEDGGFSYFLGSRTAVGMTPSLTWLSIVRSAERSGNTRYKAWISPAEGSEANGTLGRALERLGGTFDAFGFEVDTGRNLPPEMSDAKLAVITAHGGLTAEGRFIHSISDEDSLIETPTALAAALAGIEVVILFVCSGGRIDKHPWGNTTVGLPKMLLEKGCRVVIASPWPLDVKVTYNWLEPFMRKWDTGATILQATTEANAEVARRLGDHPQYSLGMTAYGDILLTK